MTNDDHFLSRPQATKYLNDRGIQLGENFLGQAASRGGGPLYRRLGKQALYLRSDLDAWIDTKISRPLRSTSDLSA